MEKIIVVSNLEKGEYFFTTKHHQEHGLGDEWVAMTTTIPMRVTPREDVPDGVIKNKEQYKKVFEKDSVEIPNPDPEYQG